MKLPRQEILSILVTFVVGFLAGGYLYLNEFTKMVSPDVVADVQDVEQLNITSEAYGGCRDMCPAFQVKSDGSYRYRYTPAVGSDEVFRDGTLPLDIQRLVKRDLDAKSLAAQSENINATSCSSFTDGIDINYSIVLSGESYELDSCATAVDFESDTWLALAKIWNYFETVK